MNAMISGERGDGLCAVEIDLGIGGRREQHGQADGGDGEVGGPSS